MGVSSSEPSFTVFHIGRAAGATTNASRLRYASATTSASRLRCVAAPIGDTMTAAVRGAAA
jgi:hypothetical protein